MYSFDKQSVSLAATKLATDEIIGYGTISDANGVRNGELWIAVLRAKRTFYYHLSERKEATASASYGGYRILLKADITKNFYQRGGMVPLVGSTTKPHATVQTTFAINDTPTATGATKLRPLGSLVQTAELPTTAGSSGISTAVYTQSFNPLGRPASELDINKGLVQASSSGAGSLDCNDAAEAVADGAAAWAGAGFAGAKLITVFEGGVLGALMGKPLAGGGIALGVELQTNALDAGGAVATQLAHSFYRGAALFACKNVTGLTSQGPLSNTVRVGGGAAPAEDMNTEWGCLQLVLSTLTEWEIKASEVSVTVSQYLECAEEGWVDGGPS